MTEKTFTTLTFYQFKGFFPKYVAISAMGISKFWFPKPKSASVCKLLGTGSGLGFSRKPNYGQYAHFGVWEKPGDELDYQENNFLLRWLKKTSHTTIRFELEPYQSRGIWDGKNPYPTIPANGTENGSVAILTRAKVKPQHILDFWKHVAPSNFRLSESEGRLFSAGLGEWPFSHPITFSVWESIEKATAFAYEKPEHAAAIKGAREGGWFREDLFVRYRMAQKKASVD